MICGCAVVVVKSFVPAFPRTKKGETHFYLKKRRCPGEFRQRHVTCQGRFWSWLDSGKMGGSGLGEDSDCTAKGVFTFDHKEKYINESLFGYCCGHLSVIAFLNSVCWKSFHRRYWRCASGRQACTHGFLRRRDVQWKLKLIVDFCLMYFVCFIGWKLC